MIRFWDNEKDNYLIEIYKNRSNEEITNMFNKKFCTNLTKSAVNSRKKRLNLISNYKYMPKYTNEIKEYIKLNHIGKSSIELAKEVSEKFNIDVDNNGIQNIKSKIRINEGFVFEPARNDGRIKKGNIPTNKGKKWDQYLSREKQERCRTTTFKKGNISANADPIGTEKIKYSKGDDISYICVKIQDGSLHKNWRPKHILIYEKEHGKVPKGHKVIFADGNRRNFDIDNLILVSNAEELIMNRNKLMFKDKDLTKTGSIIAKVIDRTNKVKNERL